MSELLRKQWLESWENLVAARQSFGDAVDVDAKRAALQDMIAMSDAFKAACVGFSACIGYARGRDRRP